MKGVPGIIEPQVSAARRLDRVFRYVASAIRMQVALRHRGIRIHVPRRFIRDCPPSLS